jgi:hypothetical protein
MKRIDKQEFYEHLCGFLKDKGILLQEGSYTQRIQQGCSILVDTINLTQQAVEKAKTEVDSKLDQVRQTIHEKTAPKPPPTTGPQGAEASTPPASAAHEPQPEPQPQPGAPLPPPAQPASPPKRGAPQRSRAAKASSQRRKPRRGKKT